MRQNELAQVEPKRLVPRRRGTSEITRRLRQPTKTTRLLKEKTGAYERRVTLSSSMLTRMVLYLITLRQSLLPCLRSMGSASGFPIPWLSERIAAHQSLPIIYQGASLPLR